MNIINDFRAYKDCLKETLASFRFRYLNRKDKWGHIGIGTVVHSPSKVAGRENIFLGDRVNIDWDNTIYALRGKFIMGDYSGAAIGLTVITDNHVTIPGQKFKSEMVGGNNNLVGADVIVGEDVWIASNVTLLSGAQIGRGAIIGAGSVVRKQIPPYAIVEGNPSKVVGFRFNPDEIIAHEEQMYSPNNRLSRDFIEKNYEKYFLKRLKEIKEFTKV